MYLGVGVKPVFGRGNRDSDSAKTALSQGRVLGEVEERGDEGRVWITPGLEVRVRYEL